MTKRFCDICGREICRRDGRHITVTDLDGNIEYVNGEVKDRDSFANYKDVCPMCASGIVMYIEAIKTKGCEANN